MKTLLTKTTCSPAHLPAARPAQDPREDRELGTHGHEEHDVQGDGLVPGDAEEGTGKSVPRKALRQTEKSSLIPGTAARPRPPPRA